MSKPECLSTTLDKLKWQCYKGQKTHEHLVEYSTLGMIATWTGVLTYWLGAKRSPITPYVVLGCLGLNTGIAYFKKENKKTASYYEYLHKKIGLAQGDYRRNSSSEVEGLLSYKRSLDLDASPYAKMMYKWKTKSAISHKKSTN